MGSAKEAPRLTEQSAFRAGSEAFARGDYRAAALNFQEAWQNLSAPGSSETQSDPSSAALALFERSVVAARLLESFYRNGEPRTAVAWFRGIESQTISSSEVQKWIALSMLEAGFHDESITYFESLAINASPAGRRQMAIYKAHAYFRSGAPEAAYQSLVPEFAEPETARDAFFYAGIAYQTGRYQQAAAYCDTSARLAAGASSGADKALILKAKCLFALGDVEQAVSQLLEIIAQSQDILTIYSAFDLLRLKTAPGDFYRLEPTLRQWRGDGLFRNRQLAAEFSYWAMNPALSNSERIAGLAAFIEQHPAHPMAHEARMILSSLDLSKAESLSQVENYPAALREELDHRLAFERAALQFQQKAYHEACRQFLEISSRLNGKQRSAAIFNSAVAALYEGDEKSFAEREKQLARESDGRSSLHADLLLLGGMHFAAQSNPRAFDLIAAFARNYPTHPRIIDGKLALAELYLNLVPPQPQAAREVFSALDFQVLSDDRKERIDYAQIWAELLTPHSTLVPEKITAFLVKWPRSALRPQVMMLLATEFFEKRQYQKAREIFEGIARDHPNSNYGETALFFAAKAAGMRREPDETPGAPGLENVWDQLIVRDGRLANRARQEKAIALLRQDRFDEAVRIFDDILIAAHSPADAGLRFAAQCDKGYALFLKALAFGADHGALLEASAAFSEVINDPSAARSWKYQATVRKAKCLELMGREEEALALCRALVLGSPQEANLDPQIGSSPAEENHWLYRAGFAAMEILEKKKDWTEAVKVGESLARRDGPRAIEAGRRAEALRLRHFVWD